MVTKKKEELFKVPNSQEKPVKPKKVISEEQKQKMKLMRERSLAVRREKAQSKKAESAPVVQHQPVYTPPLPQVIPQPVPQVLPPAPPPSPVAKPSPAPKKIDYEEKMKEAEGRFKNLAEDYIKRYITEHKKALDEHVTKLKPKPINHVAPSVPVKNDFQPPKPAQPVKIAQPAQQTPLTLPTQMERFMRFSRSSALF